MSEPVSAVRSNLLRAVYLCNVVLLGYQVWPGIIAGNLRGWEPMAAVGISFYAGLSVLSVLGVRYPLAMLPLLFLQVFYKVVWLFALWLPLQLEGSASRMDLGGLDLSLAAALFAIVVLGDLVLIPWRYVMAQFVRARAGGSSVSGDMRGRDSSLPAVRGASAG